MLRVEDALERLTDSAAWRLAARARPAARARRRARRGGRAGVEAPPGGDPLEALEHYLRHGAYDRAAAEVDAVIEAGSSARAAAAVARVWLAFGERDRARAWLEPRRHDVARTPDGAALCATLGLDDAAGDAPAALARRVQDGAMTPAELARRVAGRPHRLLARPELHLVLASAYAARDPARAGRFVSRYLAAHGVGPVSVEPGEGNLLARLRPAPAPPSYDATRVSVVVAAHRAQDTLGYAVDSLLRQTHRELEVLIADDASGDGTMRWLVERYGDESRVRLFESERNQGPYGIRNALLRQARGDVLTFHDADDLALPTRIERQLAALRATGAEACVARWVRVTPGGRFVFFHDGAATRSSVVSLMMTRRAYDEVGPYRVARFGADHELLTDLRARVGVVATSQPALLGLWAERSLTRRSGGEALEDGFRSPARRRYSELVYEKVRGLVTEPEMRRQLDEAGVLSVPAEVRSVEPRGGGAQRLQ